LAISTLAGNTMNKLNHQTTIEEINEIIGRVSKNALDMDVWVLSGHDSESIKILRYNPFKRLFTVVHYVNGEGRKKATFAGVSAAVMMYNSFGKE
jgi:hypothetical protein